MGNNKINEILVNMGPDARKEILDSLVDQLLTNLSESDKKRMLQKVMAAFNPGHLESGFGKRCNRGPRVDARQSAHICTVTRWTPTNSVVEGGRPCSSRHRSIASLILSMRASNDLA